MKHIRRARIVLVLAGFAVAGLLIAWWLTPRQPPSQQPPQSPPEPDFGNPADGFILDVQTDPLPDPVALGDLAPAVTRFKLRITAVGEDGARGLLTLEEESLSFNDYGDATATATKKPTTLAVTLRKTEATLAFTLNPTGAWYDISEGTLYDVVAEDGRLANRLRYLRPPDPGITHTLIVRSAGGEAGASPERILELRHSGGSRIQGGPMPEKFDLYTLIRNTYDSPRLGRATTHQQVHVRGSLAGGGELDLDPNSLHLAQTGRVMGGTCVYRAPFAVTFRELGPDPAGKGRRAFDLVPSTAEGRKLLALIDTRSYILVLAADRVGPHRLVVKQDGAVRQLLALEEYNPKHPAPHPAMLATLSETERAVVVRLRDRYGENARFYANDGRVWYVVLLDADDDALPALRELKGLRYLYVAGRRLSDEALRTLGTLTQLRELTVQADRATDAGLAHLEPLRALTHLNVHMLPVSKAAIGTLRAKLPNLRPWPPTPNP